MQRKGKWGINETSNTVWESIQVKKSNSVIFFYAIIRVIFGHLKLKYTMRKILYSKDSGSEIKRIVFNDKTPQYIVDEADYIVYVLMGGKELRAYSLK